jgi:iron complex outermembrane recepter protein
MLPRLILFFSLIICSTFTAVAQKADSTKEAILQEVIIKAFENNRKLKDVPAAVNYIGRSTLERYGPASIVQAVNSTPGIRMEERSPGSYRINIRGSSLRSPFGVRNVKVYFNDIPITDPGGHTYLNQLGYYNFNSLEIIKGPGSSLYGAGTGGVMLIESLNKNEQPGVFGEYAGGSYGLQNIYGSITTASEKLTSRAGIQHQESSGYRNHSALKRDVYNWTGLFNVGEKRELKTTFLYGNLFYETPGALTRAEYDANPKASRPGSAAFPSAQVAQASVTQKQFITGISYSQPVLSNVQNTSTLYGMFTELRNPTIQNYGRSTEPHVGGRTVFKYTQTLGQAALNIDLGGELQAGFTSANIHKNVNGNADSLLTFDEIYNRQSLVFTQASFDNKDWTLTAGASLNFLRVKFERFAPASLGKLTKVFNNQVAPRVALLRKINKVNVYTSIGRGFSPPTTAELLPTGGAINLDLNAEEGINYDIGLKGTLWNDLYFDVNAFIFRLDNTIVQRRTAGGGDFYANAGKTNQHGIETYISYPLLQSSHFIDRSTLWLSHTWHDFHYKDFKQLTNDYSGNQLPGVAPHTISTGWDFVTKKGLLATVSYYFSDKIPLNDAGSAYADAYHLVSLKAGYQKWLKEKWRIKLFGGVDNLFNQKYSLGNDVNGFNGRYYNAAAGRNYYVALILQLAGKKVE